MTAPDLISKEPLSSSCAALLLLLPQHQPGPGELLSTIADNSVRLMVLDYQTKGVYRAGQRLPALFYFMRVLLPAFTVMPSDTPHLDAQNYMT